MFENLGKCKINNLYEFPYQAYYELENNELLIITEFKNLAEKQEYEKLFPQDLYKLKSLSNQIKIISFYDVNGQLIKLYRKYNKLLNIANNTYIDKRSPKQFDCALVFLKE